MALTAPGSAETLPDYDRRKALGAAIMAAGAASDVLLRRFRPPADRPLDTWQKSPGQLVTDADVAADKAISEALQNYGVPGNILSEESILDRDGDGLTWLVDPLCGTTPYSTGLAHWGINIALRRGANLEIGVVALPQVDERLSAARGAGVSRNGDPFTSKGPGTELAESTVALEVDGGAEWTRLLQGHLDWLGSVGIVNSFSSASYPMAQLCLGRLSAVVFYRVEPMHLAASAVIAYELGIHVTDGAGGTIDWSGDGEIPVAVAGWPEVHPELIAAMQHSQGGS